MTCWPNGKASDYGVILLFGNAAMETNPLVFFVLQRKGIRRVAFDLCYLLLPLLAI